MKLSNLLTLTSALLATTIAAPIEEATEFGPDLEDRASNPSTYTLQIGGGRFDLNELQSLSLFYANTSAYLGQIKYQIYSEPLIVSGAQRDGSGGDGISFQSIHQSPTGWQNMYVVPRQSRPVGFSVPHGSAPAGTRTNGFSFNPANGGSLVNNGFDLFYACQDRNLAAMHTYQIYWLAGGFPRNMSCKGPLHIRAGDGCARDL
ncbi:hypothetical protein LTR96_009711 [Exophiala xenobiotica]|nr:hypothetical protein LTR96_009711 [Exophiala xenobiotica]KAK5333757.1 hypothetical protein LTR98_010095 [Exophiala xenobiotica]